MFQINFTVFALILSALASATFAFYLFRRPRSSGSRELAHLMLALCFWSAAAAFEGASTHFAGKRFWSVVSYLGSQTTPVFMLRFVVYFTRQEKDLGWWGRQGLFLFPLFSVLIAAANDLRPLLWPSLTLLQSPGPVATIPHGPWFWGEMAYAYALIVMSGFYLRRAFRRFPNLLSTQNRVLLVVSAFPWLFNILYVFGSTGHSGVVNFTPVAFTCSSLLLAWVIFRQDFFDVVPISPEQIIENLWEGILIVDSQQRVVEANLVFRKLFQWSRAARGQPVSSLLAHWPELLSILSSPTEQSWEVRLFANCPDWYELHLEPLRNQEGQCEGALLTIHNISKRKQAESALRASETRYRLLVENQMEGIAILDVRGHFDFANPAAERIMGLPPGGLLGQTLDTLVPSEQAVHIRQLAHAARNGENVNFAVEVTAASGAQRTVEISAAPQFDSEGRYSALFSIIRDVTERKKAEDALRSREAQLYSREQFLSMLNEIIRAALEAPNLPDMVQTLANRMGALLNADGCFITLWDDVEKRTIPTAACGEMRTTYPNIPSKAGEQTMTASVLEAGRVLVAEDVFHSPYLDPGIASDFPTRSLMGLPLIAGGRKLGAALIGFNTPHHFTEEEVSMGEQAAPQIALALLKEYLLQEAHQARALAESTNSQLKLAMAELDELATTDSLTGAYNRNRFDELFSYELTQFERYHQSLSLVMFDADHFKEVNDTYGHNTGDQVLTALVKAVRSNIRATDTLTRWGGEEFIILSPGIDLAEAHLLASRIHDIVAAQEFPCVGHMTISVGVTEARPGDTADLLLLRLDNAMYQAKRNGRNRVEVLP